MIVGGVRIFLFPEGVVDESFKILYPVSRISRALRFPSRFLTSSSLSFVYVYGGPGCCYGDLKHSIRGSDFSISCVVSERKAH